MAAMEKYTDEQVLYKLKHVTRESKKLPSNIDIDPKQSEKNYSLTPPDRGITARENKNYYNQRIKEVYKYGRKDVNTAVQWVITAPKDLAADQEKAFFQETYHYLNSIYGEKNCIQCVVHVDEGVKDSLGNHVAGAHHMHYTFIPAVENQSYMKPNKNGNIRKQNTYQEKISADALLNKRHLIEFHPNYQKWLDTHEIHCTVYSGITGGSNRTVSELKVETKELLKAKDQIQSLQRENEELKKTIQSLERELERKSKTADTEVEWGSQSAASWGEHFSW
jgi:hypothetical protein